MKRVLIFSSLMIATILSGCLSEKEKEEVIKQQNLRYFTDNGYIIIEGGGRGE